MATSITEQRQRWGNAIRQARQRAGLSQEQLAQRWDNSLSYLQKIETGWRGTEEIYQNLLELIRNSTGSATPKSRRRKVA